jgi:hypothetical protein
VQPPLILLITLFIKSCSMVTDMSGSIHLPQKPCYDVDLNRVASDAVVIRCDGSEANGLLDLSQLETSADKDTSKIGATKACSLDGEVGCLTSAAYPAVNIDSVDPANIARGVTIAGVIGIKRATKLCRNSGDLATFDASSASNIPRAFPPSNINTGTNIINLVIDHGLQTGDPVVITTSGTMPTPLVSGTIYYAIRVAIQTIKLAESVSHAHNGTEIDIQSQGAGEGSPHRIVSPPNDIVDIWDIIDDYNNALPHTPSESPWDDKYVCGAENFLNISGTQPYLEPTNATPPRASSPFSEIWEDQLTGLFFSNILGGMVWADGIRLCLDLNSGDGSGMWRMPTQKELMQLYVNGISRLVVAGGTWGDWAWSSTTISNSTSQAWFMALAGGRHNNYGKNALFNVFCVR